MKLREINIIQLQGVKELLVLWIKGIIKYIELNEMQ